MIVYLLVWVGGRSQISAVVRFLSKLWADRLAGLVEEANRHAHGRTLRAGWAEGGMLSKTAFEARDQSRHWLMRSMSMSLSLLANTAFFFKAASSACASLRRVSREDTSRWFEKSAYV